MDRLLRDLRAAFRGMARKPGATALAIASLGLAIGFSTAAFSVLDAYSLRELPVADPAHLAWVYVNTREHRPDDLSWAEYLAIASRARSPLPWRSAGEGPRSNCRTATISPSPPV